MTARLARPEPAEAPAFAALHVSCWREAYRGIVPDRILDAADGTTRLAAWQNSLQDHRQIVTGAYDGAMPVGFIVAGRVVEGGWADGHIHALYILASHHRLGLGRRLIASAAQQWLASGGSALSVGVLAANMPARRFYEAMGGRLVKAGTYFWDGVELDDVIYRFDDLRALSAGGGLR